jgi:hypothetical protein
MGVWWVGIYVLVWVTISRCSWKGWGKPEKFNHGCRWPDRFSKLIPLEYETWALSLYQPARIWVQFIYTWIHTFLIHISWHFIGKHPLCFHNRIATMRYLDRHWNFIHVHQLQYCGNDLIDTLVIDIGYTQLKWLSDTKLHVTETECRPPFMSSFLRQKGTTWSSSR